MSEKAMKLHRKRRCNQFFERKQKGKVFLFLNVAGIQIKQCRTTCGIRQSGGLRAVEKMNELKLLNAAKLRFTAKRITGNIIY